ncbi:MAG: lysozyme inhibitor LprI family protein [Aestuariivirga sp.]|uniref:lysozyme inhibitor LprI family protein n=1 Tax=Aestuariivirga sp. TaxID=2650926 RepID=UPI0038D14FAC
MMVNRTITAPILGLALLAAASGVADAQDDGTECSRNAETTAEMQSCADEALAQVDSQLNDIYDAIIQRLDSDGADRLRRAQRAWIAFRDAECRFQGLAAEGGSMNPVIVTECLASLTARRFDDLEAYLNCEEGDVSCVPLAPLE